MKLKKSHSVFFIFLLIWIVQSLATAFYTELYADEAYYWMYAQFLDWGYFDHPPGVAIMIWLGNFLGKNELAVRIVNVFMCAGAIWLIYLEVKPENPLLFALTTFCFLSLQLLGFVSLPDTPFFFFAIVFLCFYKRFLKKESKANLVLLGLSAALMLYSKYHGVLVILFVVLSNPKLLINYKFYLAGIVGILLFLPHIWWQVINNFPSLQYHLVERASQYKISHTLDYVLGNLPFHGGLVAIVLFISSFYYKTNNLYEKALQWNLYGTLIFFLLITFKGQHIEPNWTIFCVFPLMYLGYRVIENSPWIKAYHATVIAFSVLLLVVKIHLIHPLFTIEKDRVWDFHLSKDFSKKVEAIAGERIIAANTYQSASLLNFYTDKNYIIPSLNINSRANQYSFWEFDTLLCNADIAFVHGGQVGGEPVTGRRFYAEYVALIDDVTSLNNIKLVEPELSLIESAVNISFNVVYSINCKYNDNLQLEINIYNENLLLSQHLVPFEISNEMTFSKRFEYNIEVEQPEKVNKVLVRLSSSKLGGGNIQYTFINRNKK